MLNSLEQFHGITVYDTYSGNHASASLDTTYVLPPGSPMDVLVRRSYDYKYAA